MISSDPQTNVKKDRLTLMDNYIKNPKYKSILAFFCAFGWSLAYPLIKIGYEQFSIPSSDLGGKIIFAGVRFFFAGFFVLLFCQSRKMNLAMQQRTDISWLLLLAIVNTTLHYMFAYIGLGYNASARSTILDSMGGFFLIILSVLIFADDKLTLPKLAGCVLGIVGIISINMEPGVNYFSNITFLGDGMILLNAFCAALGGVITRVVSKKMNIMCATGLSMLIGGVFLLIIGFLIGTNHTWTWTLKGMIVLLVLILISAVCFAVYNELLACHPISKIAIYNALIPVLGVIFASLLLHEELKWQYFLAVLMVSCGIWLVNRAPHNRKQKPVTKE